jgi:hypothetical protein
MSLTSYRAAPSRATNKDCIATARRVLFSVSACASTVAGYSIPPHQLAMIKRPKQKPKSGCQPVGQSAAFEKVNGFFRIALI